MGTVETKGFSEKLESTLALYTKEVTAQIRTDTKEVADAAQKELGETSPRGRSRRKQYSKGWRATKNYEDPNTTRYVVHNQSKASLVHLLEKGHASRNGGRVKAIPHVARAEEKAIKEYLERVEKAVKG